MSLFYITLFSIIFHINFWKIYSDDDAIKLFSDLTYPKVKILDNGYILFVTYEGIYSYNSDLSNQEYSFTFNESQKFSTNEYYMKNNLNQVGISQFSAEEGGNKYVIIYANNFIYILSEKGEILFYKELENKIEVDYPVSLMPCKYYDGSYYFVISYNIANDGVYFNYYKTDINQPKIELICIQQFTYPSDTLVNPQTLSCEIMIHSSYGKIIPCFISIKLMQDSNFYFIGIIFNIETNFTYLNTSEPYLESDYKNITNIKTTLNEDKTKAFICYSIENPTKVKCLYYDINENKLYDVFITETNCNSNYFGINIFYFKETKEFIFSCIDNSKQSFYIKRVNNTFTEIDDECIYHKSFSNCNSYNYFSIIYYSKYQQYLGIIQSICNGGNFTRAFELTNYICMPPKEENVSQSESYEYFYDLIYNDYNSTDKDYILNTIRTSLIKGKFNSLILNDIQNQHKDLIIEDKKIKYQITSSYNQENCIYNNISTIILGECEKKLKETNNIEPNETLLILKMEISSEVLQIPIIEYEVYNLENKARLNLSICNETKIKIYIPVSIDENNLFKYNSSSEYYNDICFVYKTDKKIDILLNDRRNEYINNKISLCEKDCTFNEYDYKSKKVLCECSTKINLPLISEIKINKDTLLSNFKDIKRNTNIQIIKCYKNIICLKCIDKLKNNIGNMILLSIIVFHFISAIIFAIKGYKNFKNKIYEIININKKKQSQVIKGNYINVLKTINLNKKRKKKKCIQKKAKIKKNSNNPPKNRSIKIKKKTFENNNKHKTNGEIPLKSNSVLDLTNTRNSINLVINNLKNNIFVSNKKTKNKKKINKNVTYHFINDYELNNLSYINAVKIDKRSYVQYYFSLFRMKHLLIFTFYTSNDYNSKIIKISLFLFYFSLYFTTNALFFDDSTIHKIYEDKGTFNFNYQIPKIIYSTLISSVLKAFIAFFSLSEDNILELKNDDTNANKVKEVLNKLIIKFILFYIICLLFLILFWFYLSCFCGIYINTQIHLIKNILISFGLSLLYPIFIYLLPGMLRIPSLNSKEKNKACIYRISKFIQLL